MSVSTNKITFKNENYPTYVSEKLLKFYKKEELFDVTLLAKNDCVKIPAHIVVLSTLSDYFLDKFRLKYPTYFEPREIDAAALKLIVEFMYSGCIDLSLENVESILRTAKFLKIQILIDGCCDFIEKNINSSNCLKYFSLSNELCLSALKDKCLKHICMNFEEISKCKELLLLNKIDLEYLIENANPNEDRFLEECIFLAIVAWIERDRANRKHLISKLLLKVRYQLLSNEFILKNVTWILKTLDSSEPVYKLLQKHIKFSKAQSTVTDQEKRILKKNLDHDNDFLHKKSCSNSLKVLTENVRLSEFYFNSSKKIDEELPDCSSSNFRKDTLLEKPSSSSASSSSSSPSSFHFGPDSDKKKPVSKLQKEDPKLAVISSSKNHTIVIQIYDDETNSWSIYKKLPLWRRKEEFSLIVIDEMLIIVGGTIDDEVTNRVECLNLHTFEWSDLPPMQKPRRFSVLGNLNGDLCVFGSDLNSTTMEVYNFAERKWTIGCENQFAHNGVLYKVSLGNTHINYWDFFSTKLTLTKTTKTESLKYFGVAAVDDFLYVIGGIKNGELTSSVKQYDLLNDTWRDVSPLPFARSCIKATVYKNKIVCCGGSPGGKLVHEYNPETDEWKFLESLSTKTHYWSSTFCTLPIKQ